MGKRFGKCTNFGECSNANNKKVIEITEGYDAICPECKKTLTLVEKPKRMRVVIAILILSIIAVASYFIENPPRAATNPIAAEATVKDSTGHEVIINPNNCATDSTNYFKSDVFYEYDTKDIAKGDGKLKAIVEMGSERFDYYIVKRDKSGGWIKVKYSLGDKKSEAKSKDIYSSVNFEETLQKLREFINEIKKYKDTEGSFVPPKNIYFVVSSGAMEEPKVKSIVEALGKLTPPYFVNDVVDADQEAQDVYRSVLMNPRAAITELRRNAFVVDIGASNTKIAWEVNDGIIPEVTFGSDYRNSEDYKNGKINDSLVYQSIIMKLKNMPKESKGYCIIIGGTPFQLAKSKGIKNRYSRLKSPNTYCPFDLYPIEMDKTDKKNKAKREKLIGGLNIYKAICDATGCTNFIFDGDTHFGVGYLVAHCGY